MENNLNFTHTHTHTHTHIQLKGFPDCSAVKNLPANAGDTGSNPGSGRSPFSVTLNVTKKEMATHSSILTWEIPWTKEWATVHETVKSQT